MKPDGKVVLAAEPIHESFHAPGVCDSTASRSGRFGPTVGWSSGSRSRTSSRRASEQDGRSPKCHGRHAARDSLRAFVDTWPTGGAGQPPAPTGGRRGMGDPLVAGNRAAVHTRTEPARPRNWAAEGRRRGRSREPGTARCRREDRARCGTVGVHRSGRDHGLGPVRARTRLR